MKDGLTTFQREAIREVLAEFPQVERAVLFGSRAMGTWSPASDVDLALFGDSLTLEDEARIAARMEDLGLPVNVDLVRHATIQSEALREHIAKYGSAFYADTELPPAATNAIAVVANGRSVDEWQEMPLGQFVTLQRGHDLPEGQRRPGNVPILGSFGITGRHDRAKAAGPGVTVGRSGASFGVVSYSPVDYWPLNTALYVIDFHGNDERFAYYFLQQFDFKRYNSGSAQPSLNRNYIHPLPVLVPPFDEQRAIAHILGTLDDKIDLNRKMNETLEAIARAIFQSWFVAFDPVHAKARGEQPLGMSEEIAALFPNEFEDSELGPIPRGWRAGCLGAVAENPRRGIQPSEIDQETPYIGLEHMPRRSISLGEWEHAAKIESNKFAFRRGEILFGKLRPYFHKVGVAPVDGICSTDILVIRPKEDCWFGFLLGHSSSTELVSHVDAASTGTKMPRANWQDIAKFRVALPPMHLAAKFNEIAVPAIQQIIGSAHESRSLVALRDTLLPRLISGQLRVPSGASDRVEEPEGRKGLAQGVSPGTTRKECEPRNGA